MMEQTTDMQQSLWALVDFCGARNQHGVALPVQGTTEVDGKGDPYGFDTSETESKRHSFPVVFTIQMTAQRTKDLLLELKVQPHAPGCSHSHIADVLMHSLVPK